MCVVAVCVCVLGGLDLTPLCPPDLCTLTGNGVSP